MNDIDDSNIKVSENGSKTKWRIGLFIVFIFLITGFIISISAYCGGCLHSNINYITNAHLNSCVNNRQSCIVSSISSLVFGILVLLILLFILYIIVRSRKTITQTTGYQNGYFI